jgi:hypothetical protein
VNASWKVLGLLVVVASLGVGCGDDDGGGEGGGAPSADVTHSSLYEQGSRSIAGTITFPDGAPEGSLGVFFLEYDDKDGVPTSESRSVSLDGAAQSVTYVVRGLEGGHPYQVSFLVDLDASVSASDGDWFGYFGGTVESPALDASAAQPVSVDAGDVSGKDFGLGVVAAASSGSSGAGGGGGGSGFDWCIGHMGIASGKQADADCQACLETSCDPPLSTCLGDGWTDADTSGSPCEGLLACASKCACDDAACYTSCAFDPANASCLSCLQPITCINGACSDVCQPQ